MRTLTDASAEVLPAASVALCPHDVLAVAAHRRLGEAHVVARDPLAVVDREFDPRAKIAVIGRRRPNGDR